MAPQAMLLRPRVRVWYSTMTFFRSSGVYNSAPPLGPSRAFTDHALVKAKGPV